MDGFIFLIFLLFFILPFLKRISKNPKKSASNSRNYSKKATPWGADHGQVKQKRHGDMHRRDNSEAFPEDHAKRVRERDKRDRKENRRMETNIHSRMNDAMTKVSNKSDDGWGSKGESGMTSSKGVAIFFLLLFLAYFIMAAVAPDLLPRK
jgi:hypothetical protein